MATKRKRGETWHYTVRRKALLPKPVYLTFDDETEGDKYVARLETLLDQGTVPEGLLREDVPEIVTVGDAVRAYQRANAVKDTEVLRVIEERYGNTPLSGLTYAWAEDWIRSMKRGRRLAPSRIRKFKGSLQRCLFWVIARHPATLGSNPLAMLPRGYSEYATADGVAVEDVARDRRLNTGEESAIRAILAGKKPEGKQRSLTLENAPSLVLMFELALETAMRLREIYTLTAEQVDRKGRTIFLDRTKNGDKRQVPITSVALSALKSAPKAGLLFPWYTPQGKDKRADQRERTRVTSLLSRQWGRVFRSAGCDDLTFHDLRHEATARFFERTDLSDIEIALITGHRDPRMLKRYANLRASTLAQRMW